MKKLLVASDLSERSERAVQRAVQLASAHGAALTALSVVDNDLPADMAEAHERSAAASLGQLKGRLSQADGPIEIDIRVERGDPLTQIHAVAAEIGAELIVLGVHRQRPWMDLLVGSTMERLVRGASQPVLLASDPVNGPYARALCGLDLSPSCLAALWAVSRLAPEAAIETVHAVQVPFRGLLSSNDVEEASPFLAEARSRMDAWLADVSLPQQCVAPRLLAGGRAQALGQAFQESGADLIAIGAHGRSSVSPNALGSFTEELLRRRPCDILVVRA
ncbi:MAG: universal stress protein [Pseudomonadota bacterium]